MGNKPSTPPPPPGPPPAEAFLRPSQLNTDLSPPPAPKLEHKQSSQASVLEESAYEVKVKHVKSMTVDSLLIYMTTWDLKQPTSSNLPSGYDIQEHYRMIRVILRTVHEMQLNNPMDETVQLLAPKLHTFRPKDNSTKAYTNGYRHGKWVERPLLLQKTLLQKVLDHQDLEASELVLRITRSFYDGKRRTFVSGRITSPSNYGMQMSGILTPTPRDGAGRPEPARLPKRLDATACCRE